LGLTVYFAGGAKTQPNFENWRYFRKNQYSAAFSIVLCSKCTIPNSLLKSDFMFPYELDAVFEQIFSQKAASAAAG
jgi:hypothetical protein